MKRVIVLGLATASLVYALAAFADSHHETQASVPPGESAAAALEVKATSNGRITVTSSDSKHALECDVLTIPLDQEEGAHVFLARGAVVMQKDDRKIKADSIRLQIKDNGEWSFTTDAMTVGK